MMYAHPWYGRYIYYSTEPQVFRLHKQRRVELFTDEGILFKFLTSIIDYDLCFTDKFMYVIWVQLVQGTRNVLYTRKKNEV